MPRDSLSCNADVMSCEVTTSSAMRNWGERDEHVLQHGNAHIHFHQPEGRRDSQAVYLS